MLSPFPDHGLGNHDLDRRRASCPQANQLVSPKVTTRTEVGVDYDTPHVTAICVCWTAHARSTFWPAVVTGSRFRRRAGGNTTTGSGRTGHRKRFGSPHRRDGQEGTNQSSGDQATTYHRPIRANPGQGHTEKRSENLTSCATIESEIHGAHLATSCRSKPSAESTLGQSTTRNRIDTHYWPML